MKTENEIRRYAKEHPGCTPRQIRSNLRRHKVTGRQVREALGLPAPDSDKDGAIDIPRIRVRSIDEFRKAHDIPQKIRDRLANFRRGGYLTEEELRQLCGVPVQLWRRHAELPEFADHKLRHEGVVYWGAKETIVKMKQITGRA